jgi:hypothetical protein
MSLMRAYEEVVDFIAGGVSPDDVAGSRPSDATRERVSDLVRREKSTGLTAEERSELDHYLQLKHLMRLARARAQQHLTPETPSSGS